MVPHSRGRRRVYGFFRRSNSCSTNRPWVVPQARGNDIFKQIRGCPIGGFLSAIYANVKCAYDEFYFIKRWKNDKHKIYGIRQVDDLIFWVAYNNKSYCTR